MNGAPGFLERLAQRAQGQESGIRPLLPPIFSPEKPESVLPTLEERSEAPPPPKPTNLSPMPAQVSPPPAVQPPPPARPTGVHPLVEQSIPRPAPSMVPPELHHSLDLSESTPMAKPPSPQPHASQVPAAEAPLLPERQPNLPKEVNPSPPLPPPASAATLADNEALLLPLQPAPPIFTQPAAPQESSPGAVQMRGEPPAAPTVHVSIGRIEVRAVRPAQPAAAPRTEPHPSMTLDEYLRRLNEGAK